VGELPHKRAVGPSKGRTINRCARGCHLDRGIDEVVAQFAAGLARMLRDAGFDAVELHFGHHYLVSSFLSPSGIKRRDT